MKCPMEILVLTGRTMYSTSVMLELLLWLHPQYLLEMTTDKVTTPI